MRSVTRCAAFLVLCTAVTSPAAAQYPDAWVLPRGTLRASLEPRYVNIGEQFDSLGNLRPLGADFSDDSAGVRLIPTMFGPQNAVWSITGDSALRLSAGAFRTTRESDVRRFPFNFAVGLTSRLTLTVSLPIVNTRAQVDFVIDSTALGNVGWNQAAPDAANATAVANLQLLLGQLEAAAAFVDAQVAANGYDCPSGPVCDQARTASARARQIAMDLTLMSGVGVTQTAGVLPPFSPLQSSPAGQAVLAAIQSVKNDLQALGAPSVGGSLALPTAAVRTADVEGMLTDSVYGYGAAPLAFVKYRNKLGDAEVGLRFGLSQSPTLRAVLATTVRLPTGMRDRPENYTDIGTGDRQTDIEVGLESVWSPGSTVALALEARYTFQMGDRLERRVAPFDRPLAPFAAQTLVTRNLGDVVRLGLYPSLRLNEGFTAYASASWVSKGADAYTLVTDPVVPPELGGPVSAQDLERGTRWQSWYFGGGLYYRMARGRHEAKLPMEAGIDYRAAFSGKSGLAPKATTLNFFLKLYWRLWGAPPPVQEEEG